MSLSQMVNRKEKNSELYEEVYQKFRVGGIDQAMWLRVEKLINSYNIDLTGRIELIKGREPTLIDNMWVGIKKCISCDGVYTATAKRPQDIAKRRYCLTCAKEKKAFSAREQRKNRDKNSKKC